MKPGERFATTGNTGNSTGPHVHVYTRRLDGRKVDPTKRLPVEVFAQELERLEREKMERYIEGFEACMKAVKERKDDPGAPDKRKHEFWQAGWRAARYAAQGWLAEFEARKSVPDHSHKTGGPVT